MKIRRHFLNILFWSVVSAAFIGPGTITTAANSGALFGFDLMWVLLFSTMACILLQEAASRITILSGKNIGEIVALKMKGSQAMLLVLILIVLAICGGAAAYEMGNLIGAREGILLLFPGLKRWIVPVLGISAALILLVPSLKFISRLMGIMVMVLGLLILYSAIRIAPPVSDLFRGLLVPSMPSGTTAPLLALALMGTTIVPYNLFLGSGISKAVQRISEMRWGLMVAILLGGVFSLAVIIVGSAVQGEFSFTALSEALSSRSGVNGNLILGIGLFAAGFTSAITAPLASAVTLKSLFGNRNMIRWNFNGRYFRLSWLGVLLIGMTFAIIDIRPIPAIIFAQALNGIILPLVSFILVYLVHDPDLTGRRNNPWNSGLLGITLVITMIIGMHNLASAVTNLLDKPITDPAGAFAIYAILSVLFTGLFYLFLFRRKREKISN
ncbi:MAG: Nramp family divalent metal transporter [Bacteroidales bacterium]